MTSCTLRQLYADHKDKVSDKWSFYLDAYEEGGHYGAGRDLNFVRALGRMKVSQKMEINGCFATEWPRYLEGKLGMPVWDLRGHSQEILRWLREYQRGTESLIP